MVMMIKRILLFNLSKIKKNVYGSFVFVFLIAVSSFLIGISFSIEDSFSALFETVYEATNSADYSAIFPSEYLESKKGDIESFIQKSEINTAYETEDTLIFLKTAISVENKEELQGSWIIRNFDRDNLLSTVNVVEKMETQPENAIFVPYLCKTLFGFQLGENLSIKYLGEYKTFVITGFTEDILYGNRGVMAFDVPEKTFSELENSLGNDSRSALLLLKSEDKHLKQNFIPLIKEAPYATYADIVSARYSMHSTLHVYSVAILFFSIVTLIVVCLVMYFRLKDNFYKDFKTIGVMKALGISDREIRLSFVFQYIFLGFMGSVLGILLSAVLASTFIPSITAESGMKWVNFFHMMRGLEILLLNLIIVFLFAFHATVTVKKITPVAAIRGQRANYNGGISHSFFGKIPLSLDFLSAIYLLISRKKQNVSICFIVALAVLSSSFFITLFSNIVQKEDGLSQISGMEKFDIVLKPGEEADIQKLYQRISDMDNTKAVIKCIGPGGGEILCDNNVSGRITVYDDYEKLEKIGLYKGRYPFYDNEIAISVNLSKSLKKGIGDVISIRNDYQEQAPEEEYVVTGLTQGSYTGGLDIFFTYDGILKIEPDASWESMYLYLKNNRDIEVAISKIQSQMGDEITYIENFKELFNAQFASVIANVKAILLWVLFVSMFITLTTVILLVKTVVLNNESDFAVMRAIGFTTYQIARQISMSILPILTMASCIGYLLSLLFTNRILVLMLQGMGIYDLRFSLPNGYILCYAIILILSSYFLSILYVCRQSKYSPNYIINRGE